MSTSPDSTGRDFSHVREAVERALELVINESLDVIDHMQRTGSTERVMQALWLRDHLAAVLAPVVASAQAAALREALADIRDRRRAFIRLGADAEYLSALDDCYGLVNNRISTSTSTTKGNES